MAALAEAPPSAWYYEFEVVPVDRCFIDPAYQRQLSGLWKDIAKDFRPYLFGAVILSARERKAPDLAIIDGQHRWMGAKEAGVEAILAVIYPGLNRAQEAEIFAELQLRRRALLSYERFRASLVAKDPMAKSIAAICQHAGYELGPEKRPDTLKAVAALEWCYRGGKPKRQNPQPEGPEYLRRAMHSLKAAWPDYSQPNGDIIKGVVLVYLQSEGQIDDDRLVRSLNATTPREILSRAGDLKAGRGGGGMGASHVADVLSGNYAKTRK